VLNTSHSLVLSRVHEIILKYINSSCHGLYYHTHVSQIELVHAWEEGDWGYDANLAMMSSPCIKLVTRSSTINNVKAAPT
jgi:hypothetical protein